MTQYSVSTGGYTALAIRTVDSQRLRAALEDLSRKLPGWELGPEGDISVRAPGQDHWACFEPQCGEGVLVLRLVGIDGAQINSSTYAFCQGFMVSILIACFGNLIDCVAASAAPTEATLQ